MSDCKTCGRDDCEHALCAENAALLAAGEKLVEAGDDVVNWVDTQDEPFHAVLARLKHRLAEWRKVTK